MEWLNQSDVEINESGDRLEMIVRTHTGMLEWMITICISAFTVFLFAKTSPVVGLLIAAIAVFSLIKATLKSNETRLTVGSGSFIVDGANPRSVSLDEIHGIGYFIGGEDEPTGLYAFKLLGTVCLIPSLDESECQRIKCSIESKFPDMQFGKDPISGLFGDGPEIITLGLNKRATTDSEPPIS
jgi:hypothetical protein